MKNNDLTDQREFWEQKRLDECEYYAEWEEMEHEEKIKDVNGIIETLKNAPNEATRAPYWMILDPVQNMGCDIHLLACQITGPFSQGMMQSLFCKELDTIFLKGREFTVFLATTQQNMHSYLKVE